MWLSGNQQAGYGRPGHISGETDVGFSVETERFKVGNKVLKKGFTVFLVVTGVRSGRLGDD